MEVHREKRNLAHIHVLSDQLFVHNFVTNWLDQVVPHPYKEDLFNNRVFDFPNALA